MRDLSPRGKGNSRLLGGLTVSYKNESYEKITRLHSDGKMAATTDSPFKFPYLEYTELNQDFDKDLTGMLPVHMHNIAHHTLALFSLFFNDPKTNEKQTNKNKTKKIKTNRQKTKQQNKNKKTFQFCFSCTGQGELSFGLNLFGLIRNWCNTEGLG